MYPINSFSCSLKNGKIKSKERKKGKMVEQPETQKKPETACFCQKDQISGAYYPFMM
jgi:hypothetical protein